MAQTLDLILIRNFAIALFIGALIGIEREKKKEQAQFGIGGLRTFILIAAAGAICAWLGKQLDSPAVLIGGAMAITALLIAGYFGQHSAAPEAIGLTTEVAGLVTFLLGAACLYGFPEIAVALAIVSSALLAFKKSLHEVVGKLGQDDIFAGIKLLIATFVVLPLLPDHPIDPWGALNPYKLWWLVILISSLALVGYVAVRWLGPERGTAATGFFGGMVSSTAVSLSFSRRSREEGEGLVDVFATGILLAWTVMCVRVVIEVAVTDPALVPRVAVPMGALFIAALFAAAFFYWRTLHRHGDDPTAGKKRPDVALRNPFSLTSAVKFGLFFAAILLTVRIVQEHVPGNAIYVVAALAGAPGVDAITLSMANAARSGATDPLVATSCIVIGALANLVAQGGIVFVLGSRTLRNRLVLSGAIVLAATIAVLAVAMATA